jgi:glycosyltransferase involved in cell wall biosynthesis
MVCYNGERHIREAMESLLAQSWRDFTLTVVDDASTDHTAAIAAEYAARDPRVPVFRNAARQGYIGNSVAAVHRSPAGAPDGAEFFAWVSDHDVHEPRWIETLVAAFHANPNAILAYPLTVRISDTGERLPVPPTRFATCGLTREAAALAVARDGVGFGNMVYGLFRASALRSSGILRRLLLPDGVLIIEMSRLGCIVQVPEELWLRRYANLFSLARQRRNLFARPPWWTALPPGLVNPAVLLWHLALKPTAGRPSARWLGFRMAWRAGWRALALAVLPLIRPQTRTARVLRGMYHRVAR